MSSALARLPYRCGGGSSSKRGEESSHPISFVLATSRLFASRPAYVTEQPPFFNAAAAVVTRLPPLRLLRALKGLERDAGRGKEQGGEPTVRFGPRPLDLDIVFYGGLRGKLFEEENEGEGGSRDADDADADAAAAVSAAVSQGLELPHPRWRERAFVMAPACDLVGGAEEGGAEESELERLGSGLRLFGFNLTGGDDGRRGRKERRSVSHRRRGLVPPAGAPRGGGSDVDVPALEPRVGGGRDQLAVGGPPDVGDGAAVANTGLAVSVSSSVPAPALLLPSKDGQGLGKVANVVDVGPAVRGPEGEEVRAEARRGRGSGRSGSSSSAHSVVASSAQSSSSHSPPSPS